MPTEKELKEQEEKAEKEKKEEEALTPAEAKKTETPEEHMIPKSRFDEEIQKRKDAEEKLTTIQDENANQLEKQLAEQGKWKELYEESGKKLAELKPIADQVEAMEQTLIDNLAAQIKDLPEAAQELVPEMGTVKEKLDWLGQHRARLMKPVAPNISGKLGSEKGEQITLTPEEKEAAKKMRVSEEDYAKNKE